jgi:hypothetical protein
MSDVLVLACKVSDFNASTKECVAPYWTHPPYPFPSLTVEDGLLISFSIVGIWTLGLIARLVIRSTQMESRETH